uniref:ORF78 protein n=1 Tax=Thermostichus vulcanus TaxID=32053 RepID=Q56160_THEVL|nr:hypothetical protein 78 (groEL2 5'-region) - Synechococcus sp [Synechococcus sp.]BAA13081.1 ORF78 [Thermostichus vulcanus]
MALGCLAKYLIGDKGRQSIELAIAIHQLQGKGSHFPKGTLPLSSHHIYLGRTNLPVLSPLAVAEVKILLGRCKGNAKG